MSSVPSADLMWFGILVVVGAAVAVQLYFWFGADVERKRDHVHANPADGFFLEGRKKVA